MHQKLSEDALRVFDDIRTRGILLKKSGDKWYGYYRDVYDDPMPDDDVQVYLNEIRGTSLVKETLRALVGFELYVDAQ